MSIFFSTHEISWEQSIGYSYQSGKSLVRANDENIEQLLEWVRRAGQYFGKPIWIYSWNGMFAPGQPEGGEPWVGFHDGAPGPDGYDPELRFALTVTGYQSHTIEPIKYQGLHRFLAAEEGF